MYNSILTCASMQILLVTTKLVAEEFTRVDQVVKVSHCIVRGGFRNSLYRLFIDVSLLGLHTQESFVVLLDAPWSSLGVGKRFKLILF